MSREQADAAVETMPDGLVLNGWEAARLGDELLRAGRPFHAHEVFEASWKSGPAAERELWQGLAQIAVGLTHAHRGNARGAVTLLRRGAARVRGYHDPSGTGTGTGSAVTGSAVTGSAGTGPAGTGPAGAGAGAGSGAAYEMDLAGLLADGDKLAARIERHGLAAIPAADLRLGLLAPGRAQP